MKGYRGLLIVFLFIISFVFLGCDQIPFLQPKSKKSSKAKPPAGANVVAVIGDYYVTSQDLNKEVENYNARVAAQGMAQNKIDSKDKKIAYLRNEISRKYMLYQEALDRGLDKSDEVERELKAAKIDLLVGILLRDELNKIDVSSKEIEDFYNKNKDQLKDPEQRKILEIVSPTEGDAKNVYIELLKGGDFAALAKQYSKGPTASNGGDLGMIGIDPDPAKRIRFDKFYEVAFAPTLDAGGISNIFKGPNGYYIVKVEKIKKSEAKPLTELWDNIKGWLLFEKQQSTITELANKVAGETKVEIYENKVE